MLWVLAILCVAFGFFLVIKTDWIMSFIGSVDWAEQHLHTFGGTRMFIKLIGVAFILGGILGPTGLLGAMLRPLINPLTPGTTGQ